MTRDMTWLFALLVRAMHCYRACIVIDLDIRSPIGRNHDLDQLANAYLGHTYGEYK